MLYARLASLVNFARRYRETAAATAQSEKENAP